MFQATIRFQKNDKFGNPVFIASINEKERKTYDSLKNLYIKLTAKFPDSFCPIYNSEEYKYSTIRIKKQSVPDITFARNDLYKLKAEIRTHVFEGKRIISCHATELEFDSKGIVIVGELVTFD